MSERNDHTWLLARERGDDVSRIPAERRALYDSIGALIRELPEPVPSPGWRQRLVAALDQEPRTPARRWAPWVLAAAAVAALVIVVIVVWLPRHQRSSSKLAVHVSGVTSTDQPGWRRYGVASDMEQIASSSPTVFAITEIQRGDSAHRTGAVSLGDILIVRAWAKRPIELRVYGDAGESLARCTEQQGCVVLRAGDHRWYTLALVLRARGDVRTILYEDAALPPLPQGLDADLGAALSAKIAAREIGKVHVQ